LKKKEVCLFTQNFRHGDNLYWFQWKIWFQSCNVLTFSHGIIFIHSNRKKDI